MKITNTGKSDLGLDPATVVPAGRSIEIDDARLDQLKASPVVKSWLVAGVLVEEGAMQGAAAELTGRQALVADIIRGLGKTGFTKSGKPEVDAINAELTDDAEPVTASERDAVWAMIEGE